MIRYPTEDTGTGMERTATGRTRRDRTMGVVQDAVSEEVVTLVGYRTGLTADLGTKTVHSHYKPTTTNL